MAERETGSERIPVSDEDRARMANLYEEVMERIAEMAQIVAGTLELEGVGDIRVGDVKDSEARFNPAGQFGEAKEGDTQVALRVPGGSEEYTVCYADPPGVCFLCLVD